ncbi:MAG: hypothetical protein HPZ91_08665 [Lentisphaeria bacterium]|nr:hypothetical protein [Lentisphaeria bacterium]
MRKEIVCRLLIFALLFGGVTNDLFSKNLHFLQSSPANTYRGFLTESKFYLSHRPSFIIDDPARSLQNIIDRFQEYDNKASSLFEGKTVDPLVLMWSVLYVNSGKVDQDPINSALGMLCAGKYDKAQETLLAIVREKPDNYAANLLLGLLSMRDRKLFGHLEKAYQESPLKTIMLIDFLACNIQMNIPKESEWDFLEAYIGLFVHENELFLNPAFSATQLHRLNEMVRQKYFDPKNDRMLQDDKNKEAVLRRFRALMNGVIRKQVEERFNNKSNETGAVVIQPTGLVDGRFAFDLMQPEAQQKNLQVLSDLLSSGKPVPPMEELAVLPVWGGIYVGLTKYTPMPNEINPDGIAALFGLLCTGQFSPAEEMGVRLLKKNPEDFRILVLLGALAEKNDALLPYLELAFSRDPLKTIYMIDYLSRSRILPLSIHSTFFDRYTMLIYRNREVIKQKKIAKHVAAQLRRMIARKVETLSPEMRVLCFFLDNYTHDGPPSYRRSSATGEEKLIQ